MAAVDVFRRHLRSGGRPPRNGLELALDRYVRLTAPFLRGCCVFLTVAVMFLASSRFGSLAGLMLEAAFFLVAGAYCLANFARCREAHCIVTGLGWSALAVVAVTAALVGSDLRNGGWFAFLGIAVIGHSFEAVWKASRGSNALRVRA